MIADNHARLGREYRRNARGDAGMLRTAAWHEHMRQVFEEAATQSGSPIPVSQPFPPKDCEFPKKRRPRWGCEVPIPDTTPRAQVNYYPRSTLPPAPDGRRSNAAPGQPHQVPG